ncbi:MAG: lactate dehydrogenase [Nitrospinota bacterium]|nr:MAG: lactate dehydrogenase [Nitrospinota bacterium]
MEMAQDLLPDGFTLHVLDRNVSDEELQAALKDADFFLGFSWRIGKAFFEAASSLKLIQLISAGYDRIDLELARKAGIPIANNGGANAVAVAEHTLMLMLAVYKRVIYHNANVKAGKWRLVDFTELPTYELAGKTLGLVGLGMIGKKVARRALAFDMRVQYYDIFRLPEDQEDLLGIRFVSFKELLTTSDIISLHVPLNEQTRGMIGAREFALMKPTAVLINTCRGPVVDEEALYTALKEHRIAGAGLDVFAQEPPPPDNPLFALEEVVATPHIAGPTWENWPKAFRNGYLNIQRVAAGEKPLWVIPELRGYV